MRTIAITNQKGGVGKTTTAHHLAVALADRGLHVLAVDLDPQAHLTVASQVSAAMGSVHDALTSARLLAEVIFPSCHGIDVLPSEQLVARLESAGLPATRLRDILDGVADNYDVAILDTPPSLGFLSTSALLAADAGVLVPLLPEALPLKGLQHLLTTISELRAVSPGLHVLGILPTMVRPRWASHRSVLDVMPHLLADVPILDPIPCHGAVARAAARREPVFVTAPKSAAAVAYENLAGWTVGATADVRAA
jgi:chromosome partitioning protein